MKFLIKSNKALGVDGAFWMLLGYGGSQVLRLLSNLILAYFLFPAAFGLMAIINIVLAAIQLFSDFGFGLSIIRRQDSANPAFLNTAWTIQAIRGFILWLIASALAYPISLFYIDSDPIYSSLTTYLPIAGLTAIISGFNSTGITLLNKNFNFKVLAAFQLIPQLTSSLFMIVHSFFYPSIWSLVFGSIFGSFVNLIFSHILNPGPKNRFHFDFDSFKELFDFGKWVFLSTIVGFLCTNLDRFMLAKLVPLSFLGVYSIAFGFIQIVIHITERLSSNVLFPLLSRLLNDHIRMIDVSLRARSAVLWLSGFCCVFIAFISPLFFGYFYDNRYSDAPVIAQWLSLYAWSRVLILTMDRIPVVLGNSKSVFISNLLAILLMPFAFPAFLIFNMSGFILIMIISSIVSHAYLIIKIPYGRRQMMVQSVFFTLGFVSYTAPVILLLREHALTSTPLTQLALAFFALMPLGCVSAWKIYRLLRK